jgi:hypothetical protein
MTQKINDFVTLKAYVISKLTVAIANAYSLPKLKKAVRESSEEANKIIKDYAENGFVVEVGE